MKRPDILNFATGLATDELDFTTWETNTTITIRARDIHGVQDQPVTQEFPADSGPVSTIFWNDSSILVRRSRTDILADISAIVVSTALGTVYVRDEKLSGTNGGTATVGSWATRDLNTIDSDPESLASLAANQLDLVAGTYETLILVPAFKVDGFMSRLQNIDLASTLIFGSTGHCQNEENSHSIIQGVFTVAVTTTLEVQMQVEKTSGTQDNGNRKGFAGGTGEVYTIARFRRVA